VTLSTESLLISLRTDYKVLEAENQGLQYDLDTLHGEFDHLTDAYEELKEKHARLSQRYVDKCESYNELTAELAECRADAERYRWLRDNCKPGYSKAVTPHAVIKVCVGESRDGIGWFDIIGPKAKVGIVTLDQAIDAVRSKG